MLKYLFIAETYNGNIIKQTQEDLSLHIPTKSAFYDVLQENIKRFSLIGEGHLFTIDLTDGHIEVDGRTLYTQKPPDKCDLRLIYYRQVQQRMVIGDDGNSYPEPIIRYYIGWQATYKGKNYKFEMGVD